MTICYALWTRGEPDLDIATKAMTAKLESCPGVPYVIGGEFEHQAGALREAASFANGHDFDLLCWLPTDAIVTAADIKTMADCFETTADLVAVSPTLIAAPEGVVPQLRVAQATRWWCYAPQLDPRMVLWRTSWLASADIDMGFVGMDGILTADLHLQAKRAGKFVATVERVRIGYDPAEPWLQSVAAPRRARRTMDHSHNKCLMKWRHGIALDRDVAGELRGLELPEPWVLQLTADSVQQTATTGAEERA